MTSHGVTEEEVIERVIRAINESWRAGRYDAIGEFVDENAVIVPPGTDARIRGREAYVQSYRDYDQAATTHEFSPGEPLVDILGEVAVAVCPFSVAYELDGAMYREQGHDILVFARRHEEWRIIWRTMQSEQSTSHVD